MSIQHRLLVVTSAFALIVSGVSPMPGRAADLDAGDPLAASELATDTLAPQEPVTPQAFGQDDQVGLGNADPTDGLSILDAPEPNNTGSVGLSYPLVIPPGHGITPELALSYDSGGDNGWLGLGWSLDADAVVVDTSFGAPHFDAAKESESYLLDGDLLTPNANGSAWVERAPGARSDYARQVESEHERITRHRSGTGWPADYFWEVRSKDGSVRWYGARPDNGGPVSTQPATFDESAVVRNEAGHIVEWKLSAKRDVGVNLITYGYQKVTYQLVTQGDRQAWGETQQACDPSVTVCGRHTYLDHILYTDATASVTDFNGAPYRIDLIRGSESGAATRLDPIVDASLGYVDVLLDRLHSVEVRYGKPIDGKRERTHDTLVARYEFGYRQGAFGKTLLGTITQGIDTPHTHRIDWYDDLDSAKNATQLNGFAEPVSYNTFSDITDKDINADSDISALGGSVSNGGSGNIYVGFNPALPSKTGSFGGALEMSGSDTEALLEWIDLNGDNLPDKVFRNELTDVIGFRLNTGVADPAADTLAASKRIESLPGLSKDSSFAFQVSFEAYPLVAIGVGTGLAFSWSQSYFTDVNADGLVDFVHQGQVYFNRVDSAGIPRFSTSSADTAVPLGTSRLPVASSEQLDEVIAHLEKQSPPIDTVRRFTVPYTGTLKVEARVALVGSDTVDSVDGVRVAVQHNGKELKEATLNPRGARAAFTDPITVDVKAGDRLYFRAGSIDDGVADQVAWEPVVTYQSPSWQEFDANGLSQHRFSAAEDFTLAGRPDDFVAMPFAGTLRIKGEVLTHAKLTDAVSVVLIKRLPDGSQTRTVIEEIPTSKDVGATTFEKTITTAFHPDPQSPENRLPEYVSVRLVADSAIDLNDVDWSATLTFDEGATDVMDKSPKQVQPGLPDGAKRLFEEQVRADVDMYPYSNLNEGTAPIELEKGTAKYTIEVGSTQVMPEKTSTVAAVVTLKDASGLLLKQDVTLKLSGSGNARVTAKSDEFDLDVPTEDPVFVDVSIRDTLFSGKGLTLKGFSKVEKGTTTKIDGVALRWSGRQGYFPLPYRGWAVAGYAATGDRNGTPIVESAFEIKEDYRGHTPKEPKRADISLDKATPEPAHAFLSVPAGRKADTDRWVGPRATLWADAHGAQTSLLMNDSLDFSAAGSSDGTGRKAPTRLGIAGPGLNMSFGVAIVGASASLSPSWGINDFEDLNADGYPDVVSAGNVSYTNQVGDYLDPRTVTRTEVTNQDLTISLNGGLSTGMVDVVPSSKGNTNAVAGGSSNKGQQGSDSGPSYGLGISGSGGYSWSSPNASDPSTGQNDDNRKAITTLQGDFAKDTSQPKAAIQRALADVNGDGLPDSIYTTAEGVFAHYNLGYGFTKAAVKLSGGGFESKESATAGAGLGFTLPYGEFGGGVNLVWNWDWATYAWRDLNGDGIVDRLRKDGNTIKVAFGTGSGLLGEGTYGTFPVEEGSQHIAFDRGSGQGAGASATGYIGPLCVVACYLVIGGGLGYNHSVSGTNISVEDFDGDGFDDVLQSSNDDAVSVRLNRHGRTNLLSQVTNPLGGTFSVDYSREGNTVAHPDSVMVMSRLDVKDGRSVPGEAAGVSTTGHYAKSLDYASPRYDRTHRASLGFASVTTNELDTTKDDKPMRSTVQSYLNDSVFEMGRLKEVRIIDLSDGSNIRGSEVSWGIRVVRGATGLDGKDGAAKAVFVPIDELAVDLHSVASRGWSVAVAPLANDEYWYDGASRVFSKRTELSYDGRGNVLEERDLGAPDDAFDDIVTTLSYADCQDTSQAASGCLPQGDPAVPNWSAHTCASGVSLPVKVSVSGVASNGSRVLLRERSGGKNMCDNGVPTELHELVAPGTNATTNMTLTQYGDYRLVMAPPDAQGVRYTVSYQYDPDRHTDISEVVEFDVEQSKSADVLANGPVAANSTRGISSSATFDGKWGQVKSRTDANGATRNFSYDELGRIKEVSEVAVGGAGGPLVAYEYNATNTDYAYAVAKHTDAMQGNAHPPQGGPGVDTTATLDTVVFVDGLGRVRQVKRDARLVDAAGKATAGRQVSEGVEFDPLARPTVEYGPTRDAGTATTFSDPSSGVATTTTWTSYDAPEEVTEPGGRTTSFEYVWSKHEDAGPLLSWTVSKDPDGRVIELAQDVRDVVRHHIDSPGTRPGDAPPSLVTSYRVNSLGELTGMTDSAGRESSYGYDLRGNATSVATPAGGLVETRYDLAGHVETVINPAMRAVGEKSTYRYTLNRLTSIDHPGVVDDVAYTYGSTNDDGRFTAGRIAWQSDRTRRVVNSYDAAGNLIEQASTMKRHNWSPSAPNQDAFTYTTRWVYEALGRLASIEYPDAKTLSYVPADVSVASLGDASEIAALLATEEAPGEKVTYTYDSGGLLTALAGSERATEMVTEPIAPGPLGEPRTAEVPRLVTHAYSYLEERAYDPWLYPVRDMLGNGLTTVRDFDPNTRWLTGQVTSAADGAKAQNLAYSYDKVGRPVHYSNDLPDANRAIRGGAVSMDYSHDGFGRLIGSSGTFRLNTNAKPQDYSYGVEFTPSNPWSISAKKQVAAQPNGKQDPTTTYAMKRDFGSGGQAVSDSLTQEKQTRAYASTYTVNGEVASVLPGATKPKKPDPWSRSYTWTLGGSLTSATRGSTVKTFASDDTGTLRIVDGSLLDRDGRVIDEHGGGEETLFPNEWVSVRSQKIYKHINDGLGTLATQMDTDGYESKRLFLHRDVVGATNLITDAEGEGFMRREYLPSGEIWIADNKEDIRVPYKYGGGFNEEETGMILFGARWYDPQREVFLSPDPLLAMVPRAVIDQPSLGAAYTYAGASPMANIDPSGLAFFFAQQRAAMKAADVARLATHVQNLTADGKHAEAKAMLQKQAKLKVRQDRAEMLESTALIKIDLDKGEVSIGLPYGPRKTWNTSDPAGGDDASPGDDGDATNGSGAPSADNGTAGQGGTTPSLSTGTTTQTDQADGGDTAKPPSTPPDTGQVSRSDE